MSQGIDLEQFDAWRINASAVKSTARSLEKLASKILTGKSNRKGFSSALFFPRTKNPFLCINENLLPHFQELKNKTS